MSSTPTPAPPQTPEQIVGNDAAREDLLYAAFQEVERGETPTPAAEAPTEPAKAPEPDLALASPETPPQLDAAPAEAPGPEPLEPERPAEPPPPDPAVVAARAVIARLGGDPEKPETWDTTLKKVAAPPTIEDVYVDPQEVEPTVQQWISADPEIRTVDDNYKVVESEITRVNSELQTLARERNKWQAALEVPEVKSNPILVDDYTQKLRDNREARRDFADELQRLETLATKQRDWYAKRVGGYRSKATNDMRQERFGKAESERRKAVVDAHLDAFQVKWPLAFQSLVKEYNPPAHKLAKLTSDLKAYAIARANDPNEPSLNPNEIAEFMRPHFKAIADDVGKSHVAQSQEYGKRAAARTQAVTAAPAASNSEAPTKGAAQPSQKPSDLMYDLETQGLKRLQAELGLI